MTFSTPGKEGIAILMKGHSHDPVSQIKGFLNPISMMHINVYVQHFGKEPQQSENAKDYVVHIAKPTRFAFFRMVQSSSPING